MKKLMKMYNGENLIEKEIDLEKVLCFESYNDDTFVLHSINEEENGLIFNGTAFDLGELINNSKVDFYSEYITEKVDFFDGNGIKKETFLKIIIYNPGNAYISWNQVDENEYKTELLFIGGKGVKCKFETIWTADDIIWLRTHYPKSISS